MGYGAVECHHCADSHTGNHETHLVDDTVCKNPSHIILEEGIDDAVDGHDAAHPDQNLPSRESANQRINSGLGGVGAQDYPACYSGFRICVREPG